MITHIATAVMYVADQDTSLRFYSDVLGFVVIQDAEMFPGARWLELQPPGAQTTVVLSSADAFGKQPGEGAYLHFACDDAEETASLLRAAGAEVKGPSVESWGTSLKVIDPDGNEVTVRQA